MHPQRLIRLCMGVLVVAAFLAGRESRPVGAQAMGSVTIDGINLREVRLTGMPSNEPQPDVSSASFLEITLSVEGRQVKGFMLAAESVNGYVPWTEFNKHVQKYEKHDRHPPGKHAQ